MKKICIGITTFLIGISSVCAISNNFTIDSSHLSLSNNNIKENLVLGNFNESYSLSHSISTNNSKIEEEITELTKKTTYLLLGDFNNKDESCEEYYKRHQDYLNMGAYQTFPRDENTDSGYDESIANYKYAFISEFAVPSMFLQFNKLGILYNNYGDIRITINDNFIISSVLLPKVKMKEENAEDPRKYDTIETNLVITYYFLKIGDEYKLAYLYGETTEQMNNYFTELENTETKSTMQVAPSYDTNLKEVYDYSRLEAMTEDEINNIYNLNKDNIVVLNSYYNNYAVASGNGFFINNGLVITTWNFIERSLIEAQYITIKDNTGTSYEIEGIVTANPQTDIAVIKLKNKTDSQVKLGDAEVLQIEDPVISISSKTGIGLTVQKGIVVANDGYIQSSIPLSVADEGSPLLDKNGNVIGMNTSKQVNTSISLAVNVEVLKEVQNKFNNIDFSSIEAISFDKLKEQFYYVKYTDELVINNISSNKWKEYSKIGNIEENIKLELIKASYKDGVISLRYQNGISNYISSMQMASAFKEQLISEGFTEVLSGSKKCIYENSKYQVIIMDEFDYLIIIMVRL